MAEAAAVASIVGIASFGIQLTQTLYQFGCNVASVREETGYIARHVDLYANVLDILTERIDDDEPILSDAAFDLIEELKYQSKELFTQIEKSLPIPASGNHDISFLQRVKWSFRKPKVALLVGELDYLCSTVHLLVTIIFTGKKIRSRRKKAKATTSNTFTDDPDIKQRELRAQNALLAQIQAQDRVAKLEEEATHQDGHLSIGDNTVHTDLICANNSAALTNLQRSLVVYVDQAERQRAVLEQSSHVFQQLLKQWTTVDISLPHDTPRPSTDPQPVSQDSATNRNTSFGGMKVQNLAIPSHLKPQGPNQEASTSTPSSDFGQISEPPILLKTSTLGSFAVLDQERNRSRYVDEICSQSERLRYLLELCNRPEKLPKGYTKSWSRDKFRFVYLDHFNSYPYEGSFESYLDKAYLGRWIQIWDEITSKFEYYEVVDPDDDESVCRYETMLGALYSRSWYKLRGLGPKRYLYFDPTGHQLPTHIPSYITFYNRPQPFSQDDGGAETPKRGIIASDPVPQAMGAGSGPVRSTGPTANLETTEEYTELAFEGEKASRVKPKTSQRSVRSDQRQPAKGKPKPRTTELCKACRGFGGRADKVQVCACYGIDKMCKFCKGTSFQVEHRRYRCKECDGKGVVPCSY